MLKNASYRDDLYVTRAKSGTTAVSEKVVRQLSQERMTGRTRSVSQSFTRAFKVAVYDHLSLLEDNLELEGLIRQHGTACFGVGQQRDP
jgi:hypothetical protein